MDKHKFEKLSTGDKYNLICAFGEPIAVKQESHHHCSLFQLDDVYVEIKVSFPGAKEPVIKVISYDQALDLYLYHIDISDALRALH